MDIRPILKSQYHAALAMLRQAIERCPEDLWTARDHPRAFWRIAYHTLFYTDLYLRREEAEFRRWDLHRDYNENLFAGPWPAGSGPVPYTRDEVLAYWGRVDGLVNEAVDRMDLDSVSAGFHWYDMPKLDHQLMNIRHVQGHVGQLSEILMGEGIDVDWVGGGR